MTLTVFAWLLLSICFFSMGEWSSKKYILDHNIKWLGVNFIGYIGSVIPWLVALSKYNHVSVVGLIWSLLSVVSTLVVGFVIFHEPITTLKVVGMVFAFIAIVLMSL
jgi:multidrug transporter EmrE-like cation transporter